MPHIYSRFFPPDLNPKPRLATPPLSFAQPPPSAFLWPFLIPPSSQPEPHAQLALALTVWWGGVVSRGLSGLKSSVRDSVVPCSTQEAKCVNALLIGRSLLPLWEGSVPALKSPRMPSGRCYCRLHDSSLFTSLLMSSLLCFEEGFFYTMSSLIGAPIMVTQPSFHPQG